MNPQRQERQPPARGLPAWLDGRTVAIIGVVCAAAGTNLATMDARFDGVDARFDGVDGRMDGVDKRIDRVEKRIDGLDTRLHRVEIGVEGIRGHLGLLGRLPAEHRTPPPATPDAHVGGTELADR